MASNRPNVVLFFTDQQRWDTTGVHGNPMGLTPNFDRLALEGTHCYNAFTCQPVCLPARIVLQTGRYASQFGTYSNHSELPEGSTTLGHYYREAGYDTAYIGKWHMVSLGQHGPVPPERRDGYDYWLGANVLEFTSDAYQTTMYDGDGQAVRLPGYRVDAQTDAAIRYVDDHHDRDCPFFLMCSYLEPHFQNSRDDYPAPTGYEEHYRDPWTPPDLRALGGSSAQHLPGYYGMVKRLDEALGRLLDALRSLDLLDSTIVLYATDHGCHFKTRNAEYKRSCHDSSVRRAEPGLDLGDARFVEDCLYDLMADPYELNDLIGLESHRMVADVMQSRLSRRMQEAGEPAPQVERAPERRSGQKTLDQAEAQQ